MFKDKDVGDVQVMPVDETSKDKINESKSAPIFQNANFLLGRICTKDIFNFNNELLIKAHAVVNKKNLKEISKFGKIRELMLYSK